MGGDFKAIKSVINEISRMITRQSMIKPLDFFPGGSESSRGGIPLLDLNLIQEIIRTGMERRLIINQDIRIRLNVILLKMESSSVVMPIRRNVIRNPFRILSR